MPRTDIDRVRFDIAPDAGTDQQAEVDRLLSLGATRLDTGRAGTGWADTGWVDTGWVDTGWVDTGRADTGCVEPGSVELADPDGTEFCLLPTGGKGR